MPAVLYPIGPSQPVNPMMAWRPQRQNQPPQFMLDMFGGGQGGQQNNMLATMLPFLLAQQQMGLSREQLGFQREQAGDMLDLQRDQMRRLADESKAQIAALTVEREAAEDMRGLQKFEFYRNRVGGIAEAGLDLNATLTQMAEEQGRAAVAGRLAELEQREATALGRAQTIKFAIDNDEPVKAANYLQRLTRDAKGDNLYAQLALREVVNTHGAQIEEMGVGPRTLGGMAWNAAKTGIIPGAGYRELAQLEQQAGLKRRMAEARELVSQQTPEYGLALLKKKALTVPEVQKLQQERREQMRRYGELQGSTDFEQWKRADKAFLDKLAEDLGALPQALAPMTMPAPAPLTGNNDLLNELLIMGGGP